MTSPLQEPQWAETAPSTPPEHVETPDGLVGRTGLEARLTRQAMGIDAHALGRWLGLNPRTVQRWEKTTNIPPHAEYLLQILEKLFTQWVEVLTTHPDPVSTYRGRGYRCIAGRWIPEAWWGTAIGTALLHKPHNHTTTIGQCRTV